MTDAKALIRRLVDDVINANNPDAVGRAGRHIGRSIYQSPSLLIADCSNAMRVLVRTIVWWSAPRPFSSAR